MSEVRKNNFLKVAKLVSNLEFLRKSAEIQHCSEEKTALTDYIAEDEPEGTAEFTYQWTVSVFRNNIRNRLLQSLGHFASIQNEFCDTNLEKLSQYFKNSPVPQLNQAFLWAAFKGKVRCLERLHQLGADIQYTDLKIQLNALHLSAFVGSVECCRWLLTQENADLWRKTDEGLSPLHYAVLGGSGKVVEYFIENGCEATNGVLNLAVYSNSVQCLKLMVSLGLDVNAYHRGMTALHNAADLNHMQCLEYLLEFPGTRIDVKSEKTYYTALHFAAENGYTEIVKLLISRGARVMNRNKREQTALHLACQMQHLDTVECLLQSGADVNAMDLDRKTPLYYALNGKEATAILIVDLLIKWKASVNVSDRYYYTPLHMAAINEMEKCANMLIMNGANPAAKTKGGVTALRIIKRKMPACVDSIKTKFTNSLAYNTDQNVKFNFRDLLVNTTIGETDYLYTLQQDDEAEILVHPLCRAFLYLKWKKVKPYYIIRICLSLIAVIVVNLYIFFNSMQADCCYSQRQNSNSPNHSINESFADNHVCGIKDWQNITRVNACVLYFDFLRVVGLPDYIYVINIRIWIIVVSFIGFYLLRLLFSLLSYRSLKGLLNLLEILEFAVVASLYMYFIQESGSKDTWKNAYYWQRYNGALVVFLSWMHLLVLNGQLFFRSHFVMFKKASYAYLKLLFVYFCLLFGFSCTFCILFRTTSKDFQNPFIGLVKILAMMSGEIGLSEVMREIDAVLEKGMVLVLLALFIVLISFVLTNLMVGLAVSNVDAVLKTANLAKLVQQTEAIHFVEVACLNGLLPERIRRFCRKLLFVFPDSYRKAIYVRAAYQGKQALPREIINEGLELALWRKKEAAKKESKNEVKVLQEKVSEVLSKLDLLSEQVEKTLCV